jgi:hypothetical protein
MTRVRAGQRLGPAGSSACLARFAIVHPSQVKCRERSPSLASGGWLTLGIAVACGEYINGRAIRGAAGKKRSGVLFTGDASFGSVRRHASTQAVRQRGLGVQRVEPSRGTRRVAGVESATPQHGGVEDSAPGTRPNTPRQPPAGGQRRFRQAWKCGIVVQ